MKKIYLIGFLVIFTTFGYSQQLTQTIKGKVLNSESLQSLIGASVVVQNTDPIIGTTTDIDGKFKLENIPIGRHTIVISFIGYETAVIPELLVGSAKEIELEILLTESFSSLAEVTISATKKSNQALNEMATLSARSFSVEETHRYAASINDPSRMALSYAGVTNGDDESNQIIIRGNSPNGLLWRMEGVEIPAPTHFAEEGSAAGFVSILNSSMLSTSDFYTGAFPAEYNNAFSGIFDIKLRKGNSEKREYAFQIGALGTDFTMEGPLSKNHNSSYLVNYRYSTLALLQDIGIGIEGMPKYQDLSFKLYLPTTKAGVFSVWGIGGLSANLGTDPVQDSTIWDSQYSKRKSYFGTGMGAFGVTNFYSLNTKSYIRTAISASGNFSEDDISELDDNYALKKIYEDKFENNAYRINSFYNVKFNSRLTTRIGFNYNIIGFNFFAKENEGDNLVTKNQGKGQTSYFYLYNQNKYSLTEDITLNIGLAYNHIMLGNSHSIEPKASIEWDFTQKQSVGFATGIYSRHEELNAYFMAVPIDEYNYVYPNKDLDLKKTAHFILSYNNRITNKLSFKAELYYQHLYDLPISTDINSTFSTNSQDWGGGYADSLISSGIGRNYGLELTLEKRFSNQYYYTVTASLFDSKYQASDELWYNTQYNSNYAFNLIGGKEFTLGKEDNRILGLNFKGVYAGGQRYTPIDETASELAGKTVFLDKQRFENQAPSYFRIDFGLNYRVNRKRVAHILALDIQNITNHKNIRGVYYNTVSNQTVYSYGTGLVPVISYKIEF